MRKLAIALIPLWILALVVGGCGGGEEAEDATDYRTYSRFGFSFDYHKSLSITESGILSSQANEVSGQAIALRETAETVELYSVGWMEFRPDIWEELDIDQQKQALRAELESALMGFVWAGLTDLQTGEIKETTKEGHLMLYHSFSVLDPEEGEEYYGAIGALYCDKNQKEFMIATLDSTHAGEQSALGTFMTFLDSFVCH